METWVSPDQIIKKEIVNGGIFGPKPTERSICKLKFSEINLNGALSEYLDSEEKNVVIGEANTFVDRKIDEVLLTVKRNETSHVVIKTETVEVSFDLFLIEFESKGFIHEWSADLKCQIALNHKAAGIDLFQKGCFIDASHRFSKSLKFLLSIPIPVDDVPEKVDGVSITDLNNYKINLYNNLASCYSKENRHSEVILLCTKVLEFDKDNLKALMKRGFAYAGERNFDEAKIDLENVLRQDKGNKAAVDKLNYCNHNINLQNANVNDMIKKMFPK